MTDLVSTARAAEEVGVSTSTLTRWANAGYVRPAQKTIGGAKGRGHMRWNVDDLRRQIAEITDTDTPAGE